jgi:hypothetical protein
MGIKLMQEEMVSRVGKNKLRIKRVIIAGAIGASIVVGGLWMGFNAMADLLNPAREDSKASESLDQIGDLQTSDNYGKVTTVWDDHKIAQTIHAMSHQKVEADQKWTSIEMTQDRIITLSNVVEQNKDTLEYYDTFTDILDRWADGDFSQADSDHNDVWYILDGTIGKATGILSDAEEKEFVEDVFE